MKLKRFLTLIASLIIAMTMLTGCVEIPSTANVSLKFDIQTIKLNSDQRGYVYLEIDVKDGDFEDTYVKRFAVSKNQTLTIGIEDIVPDFFTKDAQICNVKVVETTIEFMGTMLFVIAFLVLLGVVLAVCHAIKEK